MEVIYKNSYFEVLHDASKEMFHYAYNESSYHMQPTEYIQLLEDFIQLTYQHCPRLMLGDMMDFQFIITPDIQEWIDQNLFKVYKEVGFKKMTLLLSKEYVPKLSIQQAMDEDTTNAFKTQYFDDQEKALAWLLAG